MSTRSTVVLTGEALLLAAAAVVAALTSTAADWQPIGLVLLLRSPVMVWLESGPSSALPGERGAPFHTPRRARSRSFTCRCSRLVGLAQDLSAQDRAAVDADQLTGDVAGVSRGEEANRRSDLFRGARPPHQSAVDPHFVKLGIKSISEEFSVGDIARQDKVGGDSLTTKPVGEPENPGVQGGLGCAVGSAVPTA